MTAHIVEPIYTAIKIRPANCQTCEYGEEKLIGKEVKRVCVFNNPEANPEGRAVWPIVEDNDWCRRHKFDSVRITITGESSEDVGGNI
jgi:hypothetical protein